MRKIATTLIVLVCFLSSCDLIIGRRVKGNGNIITQERSIRTAHKIKLAGSYDVELTKSSSPSLKINADDNLMSHIITENEGDWLVIKSREHEHLVPTDKIKIFISTEDLEAIELAGSGNIRGNDKFSTDNNLVLKIAGSGSMDLQIHSPKVKAEIAGSGNVNISGETKDQEISIAGHGDYLGENLKAENTTVRIAGSGNVKIFADNTLDIHIAGSGSVFYKGNPKISQHIAGSGEIKQLQ
jgi:hypothetical protein